MTPESNPRPVFERLFGAGDSKERAESLGRRYAAKKSMLDFVEHDAKALQRHLGRSDQQKLDEYLTGVREIEQQIEKAEAMGLPHDPGVAAPEGMPGSYEEHLRLMMDMMVLAFKTDSTRISTFLLAHDGSNRSFKEIGVSDGHHNISHHQRQAGQPREDRQDRPLLHGAARLLPRQAEEDRGRRRQVAAAQLDDRLRRRHLRRQPPQPRRPARSSSPATAAAPSSPAATSISAKTSRWPTSISACWKRWA